MTVEEVAAERQRLWLRLSRDPHPAISERVVELTRMLNGHAGDIRLHEPERFYRSSGVFGERRTAVVESEAVK